MKSKLKVLTVFFLSEFIRINGSHAQTRYRCVVTFAPSLCPAVLRETNIFVRKAVMMVRKILCNLFYSFKFTLTDWGKQYFKYSIEWESNPQPSRVPCVIYMLNNKKWTCYQVRVACVPTQRYYSVVADTPVERCLVLIYQKCIIMCCARGNVIRYESFNYIFLASPGRRNLSPLTSEFWRHCRLSGGTQCRVWLCYQSEKMEILNI